MTIISKSLTYIRINRNSLAVDHFVLAYLIPYTPPDHHTASKDSKVCNKTKVNEQVLLIKSIECEQNHC